MAKYERQYDFQNGTRTDADQVDAEFNAVAAAINATDDDLQGYKPQVSEEISRAVANATGTKLTETGTSFPSNPSEGQTFYHKNDDVEYIFVSGEWKRNREDLNPVYKQIANLNLQLEASARITDGGIIATTGVTEFGVSRITKETFAPAMTYPGELLGYDTLGSFIVGDEITVYDDVNLERVKITAVNTPTKSFTVEPALTKTFKAGANIKTTMMVSRQFEEGFEYSGWKQSDVSYPAISSKAYASSYKYTSGQMTALDDGRIAILSTSNETVSITIWKSDFSAYNSYNFQSLSTKFSLVSVGNYLCAVHVESGALKVTVLHADVGVINTYSLGIVGALSYYSNISVQTEGSNLHIACSADSSLYYVKTNLTLDGGLETSVFEKVSTSSIRNVKVLVVQNVPVIIYQSDTGGSNNSHYVYKVHRASGSWSKSLQVFYVYDSQRYELNAHVDRNNRIWFWFCYYSGMSSDIHLYYANTTGYNAAVFTQLGGGALGTGYTNANASTASVYETSDSLIFYISSGDTSLIAAKYIQINKTTFTKGTMTSLGVNSYAGFEVLNNPNVVFDDFTKPILYYGSNVNEVRLTSMGGTYKAPKNTNILVNDMRFSLGNYKEVVLYVQHDAGLTIEGYANGAEMAKTVNGNETQLVINQDSAQETIIRLTATRVDTSSKQINKILGGVS